MLSAGFQIFRTVSYFSRIFIRHFKSLAEMRDIFNQACALGLNKYPKVSDKFLEYGTAGFREKAEKLNHVMYRMGLLSVIRSKALNGHTVGMMITASHNPEDDNGVKLCDPSGCMLSIEWEGFATDLINSEDETIPEVLSKIISTQNIDYNALASIVLGKDTRKSSDSLAQAALDGIKVLNGDVLDFGLLTTPQLHYITCCKNYPEYGLATTTGYYEKISRAFNAMKSDRKDFKKYVSKIFVDGANGVGALKLKEIQSYVPSLKIEVFNDGSEGVLNFKCGADYVKFEQREPNGCSLETGVKYASVDGDADRLLCYYKDASGVFHLMDGDKIASLFIKFLKELVQQTGLQLKLTVVQTAYANSSSTNYIRNVMNVPVSCVPTGVKHLHHEAMKHDIAVYFEANGHGTVLFSKEAELHITNISLNSNAGHAQQTASKKLLNAIGIINQTTGDAISDLLFIEAILESLDWSFEEWDAVYTDCPSRQLKVQVPDRSAVTTTDAGRQCLTPKGLQEAINEAVLKHKNGRSFVRPSGTEDIVRVYAEAETQDQADQLAEEVRQLVQQFTT